MRRVRALFLALAVCLASFDLVLGFLPTAYPAALLGCSAAACTSFWRLCATNENDSTAQRCKDEMMLLAKLNQGDDSISEFKDFWFSEYGPDVQELMTEADFGIGKGPTHWEASEATFLDLIQRYPDFLEPQVRLSKLHCLQGRFEEAANLAKPVLECKPWHFVALETLVAVYTIQGNTVMAEVYKSRRLPFPSQKEAREQWVSRALLDAEELLGRMDRDHES